MAHLPNPLPPQLPVCSELTAALPRFDKQFVTLCGMLDSTRHYVNTVQIARLVARLKI